MTDERKKRLLEKDELETAIAKHEARLTGFRQALADWAAALEHPKRVAIMNSPLGLQSLPDSRDIVMAEYPTFPAGEEVCRALCEYQRDWAALQKVEGQLKD